MPAYCYLLRCGDGSYYCGWTTDLAQRIETHQSGKGSRYTRAHLPVVLAYYELCEDQAAAMRREAEIKRMSHLQKDKMARKFRESHE